MSKFQIVTPCRRYNISEILYKNLKPYTKKFDITWYIIYDTYSKVINPSLEEPWIHKYNYRNPESKGGHDQLNFALQLFDDGIFFPLDDDTVMHPDFFQMISDYADMTGKLGFLFHDMLRDGTVFPAYPHNIKECVVGQQNFALDRRLIEDRKYGLNYTSDGAFIEKLYNDRPNDFCFIDKILAFHNRLRVSNWELYV